VTLGGLTPAARWLRARAVCVVPVLLAVVCARATAQSSGREVHAEVLFGTAWSLPTPLIIRVPNTAPIRRRGRYSTHPWSDAPYYAYRVGVGSLSERGVPAAYEVELLHHKLYLDDPRPPVEHFEVTHGYNLVTANVVRPANQFAARFGVGLVIAHAEGRIAGERVGGTRRTFLGGGYHIAGLTAQLAVGRRYAFARGRVAVYALPEVKVTASIARVPLGDAGGRVLVPNIAVHALAGLGVRRVAGSG
jgi:hypothetical protein